jgi:hypothetical protein
MAVEGAFRAAAADPIHILVDPDVIEPLLLGALKGEHEQARCIQLCRDRRHRHGKHPSVVTVNDADGGVIEIIEQYPIENRIAAYTMARRLAGLLDLPLKLRMDRDREPHLLDRRPITRSSWCLQFSADL